MALERRNGNIYFYRYVRDGEKVNKVYMGAGASARISAEQAILRKTGEKARAEQEREDRKRMNALAKPVLELEDVARVLARAHLVAGGYRRVKGEWRMPRDE